MDKARSLYLEVVRIVAAFYVFIYHFGSEPVDGAIFLSSPTFNLRFHISWYSAHFFVIVFFVLSGFLITMSAHKKGLDFRSFLIARLGRMYSVVLPALVFSYGVAFALTKKKHAILDTNRLIPRFLLNVSFLTQSWTLCALPPANGPFWSVSYEVMYYLVAGSILLIRRPYKYAAFLFFLLLAGPKVSLLFPCWLVGSLLFYVTKRDRFLPHSISILLFGASSLALIYFMVDPYSFPLLRLDDIIVFHYDLLFSWNFAADYLFAVLVFLNFYSFFGCSKKLIPYLAGIKKARMIEGIYKMGNCTFTLYLFHVPLMMLLALVLPYNKLNPWHNVAILFLTLLLVYVIARKTEWKVAYWREWVGKLFTFFYENKIIQQMRLAIRHSKSSF